MNGVVENGAPPAGNEGPALLPFIAGIKAPVALDLSKSNAENWTLWKQQWANYEIVSRLNTQPVPYQTAMFLNSIGRDALKIYNGFVFAADEVQDIATIKAKFDQHIIGQINETYERYVFNGRNQLNDESFDTYLTDLRNLMKSCNFCNCLRDTLLRDRIVMGIRSQDTRKKLLEIPNLTLDICINTVRVNKDSGERAKVMGGAAMNEDVHSVHKISTRKPTPNRSKQRSTPFTSQKGNNSKKCKFCNQKHEFKKGVCPAWGQTCDYCGGRNHFAVACKKRRGRVHAVQDGCDSDADYEQISAVTSIPDYHQGISRQIFAQMEIDSKLVKLQVDSGASVNLISRSLINQSTFSPTTRTLMMWNESKMKALGETRVKLINPVNGKKYAVKFNVLLWMA